MSSSLQHVIPKIRNVYIFHKSERIFIKMKVSLVLERALHSAAIHNICIIHMSAEPNAFRTHFSIFRTCHHSKSSRPSVRQTLINCYSAAQNEKCAYTLVVMAKKKCCFEQIPPSILGILLVGAHQTPNIFECANFAGVI